MPIKNTLNYLFVVHLVLVLNFGPAFHRAHFIGHNSSCLFCESLGHQQNRLSELVNSGPLSDAEHALNADEVCCNHSCCTDLDDHYSELNIVSRDRSGSDLANRNLKQHDCLICLFFNSYHVVVELATSTVSAACISHFIPLVGVREHETVSRFHSRGPPVQRSSAFMIVVS